MYAALSLLWILTYHDAGGLRTGWFAVFIDVGQLFSYNLNDLLGTSLFSFSPSPHSIRTKHHAPINQPSSYQPINPTQPTCSQSVSSWWKSLLPGKKPRSTSFSPRCKPPLSPSVSSSRVVSQNLSALTFAPSSLVPTMSWTRPISKKRVGPVDLPTIRCALLPFLCWVLRFSPGFCRGVGPNAGSGKTRKTPRRRRRKRQRTRAHTLLARV